MVLRAPNPGRAVELSGMAQTLGYSLAALGPVAVGALHDWTGGWSVPLGALLILTLPLAAVGVGAGRDRLVAPVGSSRQFVSAGS
jgi:MFS transporter, CP family, cyanate transporter